MAILTKASTGVNWLHQMNPVILHLDLKPANILLDDHFRAKIADFGLSQIVSKDDKSRFLKMGGTPLYMPPEMFATPPIPSTKCDVYAFGIIIWELLIERIPYYDSDIKSSEELFEKVKGGTRPSIPKNCPPPLQKLITKCWNEDPEKRPSLIEIIESNVFNDSFLDAMAAGSEIAREMWSKFGPDTKEVKWQDFLESFALLLNINVSGTELEVKCLQKILNANVSPFTVSVQNFEKFLRWFGPIEPGFGLLAQVREILKLKFFHGDISPEQAEDILRSVKPRSYLVRFSKEPGQVSISYTKQHKSGTAKMIHARISNQNIKKQVKEFAKKK